ncbi:4-hydroxybenzoate 3-monooxygenase [Streptomyces armeniacus]|uniref:4-hydroxybenzoate 3-monooxygenase n=1 Tax=Streptomyces armeniacus TaxID=83291 RepID=A0A345XQ14_9ACTN|nr:4-hydroxybenzoate 3-monooxygenase [Streptomyces armeniacus]AXK33730.1 4-hydroxybenzoate 3-monooxygenase [Streptomyces armeniacus]QIQ28654.1 Nbc58 [Streptomyces sp.]
MNRLRTQVAIVGAGPAGLLLSHLLHQQGVESVVLERRSRQYVEQRVRAGLLEHGSVQVLRDAGLAGRLDRQALHHDGLELRVDGQRHRLNVTRLAGCSTYVYGQQELVKDLIAAREEAGGQIWFEVDDVVPELSHDGPSTVRCTLDGQPTEISCDFVAGCDGFHGVTRPSIPEGHLTTYDRTYPSAWLGVLAAAPPASEELVYAVHERGFALASMRSPEVSRLYLQVEEGDSVDNWPDDRIWKELHARLSVTGEAELTEGPILEKSVVALRSFVAEPMQHGPLFLAGDAAHIVPPTAAKGLNLAVEDVTVLSEAFHAWYSDGDRALLDGYSDRRLPSIWEAEEFSDWMAGLLHRPPEGDRYGARLQRARLDAVVNSPASGRQFAERYVGLARQYAGGERSGQRTP